MAWIPIDLNWIWIVPMTILSCLLAYAILDGLLFKPGEEDEYLSNPDIPDFRLNVLSEVQRCSVIVGFLGTLVGTYQVLQSLGTNRGADTFHDMFSGIATAVTSSIIGCIMFLLAIAGDRLIRTRWSLSRRLWRNHWYFRRGIANASLNTPPSPTTECHE